MRTVLFLSAAFVFSGLNAQTAERADIIFSTSPGATLNFYDSNDSSAAFAHRGYYGIRVPVSAEYAFGRRAGISANFTYTRLIAGEDFHPSNLTVLDFGLGLRLHSPSKNGRFVWFGETGLHYSKLSYSHSDDTVNEAADANGYSIYFDAGANVSLSSDQKFGMGLSVNGDGYKYPNVRYTSTAGPASGFTIGAMALSLGINFYYKL